MEMSICKLGDVIMVKLLVKLFGILLIALIISLPVGAETCKEKENKCWDICTEIRRTVKTDTDIQVVHLIL